MKEARLAVYTAIIITTALAMALVAGCGGGSSSNGQITHSVGSEWSGSITGLDTVPPDNDTNVPLDAWIEVFWPDQNHQPPAQFTMRLEKEEHPDDWGGIHSKLRLDYSNPNGGVWWFQPVNNFSPFTNYRIVVTDGSDNRAEIYFRTSNWVESGKGLATRGLGTSAAAAQHYRPEGAKNLPADEGGSAIDHVITTGR